MSQIRGPRKLQLLECPTEILEDRTVDEFELTSGGKDRNQARNAVDDKARLMLASARRLLRLCAIAQVDDEGDAFIRSVEERTAHQHRDTRAVLPDELLL